MPQSQAISSGPRMRYLITGGAGFIGSHLAEFLLQFGHEVVVWDNLSTGQAANLKRCEGLAGFSSIFSDMCGDSVFDSVVGSCDAVFHLAAAVGVQLIVNDPVRTIETNINGTQVALHAAAKHQKPILVTSTSEVYGKSNKIPFSEDDDTTYGPTTRRRWSYAISKAVDEFLLLAYHESHALPGVIVRLFNTVGPRQSPSYGMVLPRFVEQALRGDELTVFGDGTQSRCFCHVAEIVPALVKLLHCDDARGQVVNLGSSEEITMTQLAGRVIERVNPTLRIKYIPYSVAYQPGFEDMPRRVPDTTKARRLIGFEPMMTLDQIIDSVAAEMSE
jgi:UDP-glucose 4-epimerase